VVCLIFIIIIIIIIFTCLYANIIAANNGGNTVTDVTDKAAYAEATGSGVTVVDFWAPWCKNCKKVSPLVDKLANDLPTVKFVKVNTNELEELSTELGVEALPTFFFYKDGAKVGEFKGSDSAKLEAAIRGL
jgi:thioredoxin 1